MCVSLHTARLNIHIAVCAQSLTVFPSAVSVDKSTVLGAGVGCLVSFFGQGLAGSFLLMLYAEIQW